VVTLYFVSYENSYFYYNVFKKLGNYLRNFGPFFSSSGDQCVSIVLSLWRMFLYYVCAINVILFHVPFLISFVSLLSLLLNTNVIDSVGNYYMVVRVHTDDRKYRI
jgi:hypothetical protein